MGERGVWNVPSDSGKSTKWGELLPLVPTRDGVDAIDLDLSELTFVDPLFLIRLRGFLDWHAARGLKIDVTKPKLPHVSNYIARMGVCDDLSSNCSFDPGQANARPRGDVLIPLTRLDGPHELPVLDAAVEEILQAQFTGKLGQLAGAFAMAIGEMCDNAATHGRSDHQTYVAAQRYQGSRLVLAIGDLGIGIPAHLRRAHPHLTDDGDAIAEATKLSVTGVLDSTAPHRGNGYDHVLTTMHETAVPKGLLRIWSARGRFSLSMTDGRQTMRRGHRTDMPTAGTWVRLELASS